MAGGGSPAGRRSIAVLGPEGQAARLLLMNATLWEALTGADHEAFCALADWHGELFRWLEREVQEHGPRDWPQLREALAGEPFADAARTLVDGADVHEPATLENLQALAERVRKAPDQQRARQILSGLGRTPRPG
jgi:DNA primase